MVEAVYFLCFATSLAVSVLLLRAYSRSRVSILLWSGLGFLGLCLSNALLIIDLVFFPIDLDLSVIRRLPALLGMGLLLYGFIWKNE